MDHTPFKCENCKLDHCQFCDGGLFLCKVCSSFEGATTTHCPGRRMTNEEIDLVYAGKLDFINGEWKKQASGSCFSHFERREDGIYLNGKLYA